MDFSNLEKISQYTWELPQYFNNKMKVPARIYASEKLIKNMNEGVLKQLSNIASLPGIIEHVCCMPDGHLGYGFPIGGVAAIDPYIGVISPGGIGFDINCGVRLIRTNLTYREIKPYIETLMNKLFKRIPSGLGSRTHFNFSEQEFKSILKRGSKYLVQKGYGWNEDLEATEDNGCIQGADISKVSQKAISRGYLHLGTLGSGNHYLEIQVVEKNDILDKKLAEKMGITHSNQILIMFHCGSRGFGHQIATDYLRHFLKVMKPKYNLKTYDTKLAHAPFKSKDGQNYFTAMKCAVNFAYANRQLILHEIRKIFADIFDSSPKDLGLIQIYDVCHNIAKLEKHKINGKIKTILIHRKGATRSFGPNALQIPKKYSFTGQPVIIGGSMETGSFLLAGNNDSNKTFYSTAHGSGRKISRNEAKKKFKSIDFVNKMRNNGIIIKTKSVKNLAEEAGEAYNNIDEVINSLIFNNINKPIARLKPIGNIKG